MFRPFPHPLLGLLVAALAPPCMADATEDAARRVIQSKCLACHGQSAASGLRLDSREAMLRGGKRGAAVAAGRPGESLLVAAIRSDARRTSITPRMPPGAPLTPDEIRAIEAWIAAGAPWDSAGEHWAFRSLAAPGQGDSIDALITRALQTRRLTPNPPAPRATLIRRVHFDLTGLPPSVEEFERASSDTRQDWFAHLVDRLLASPHFGEKWGRHWLDVARYGEDDYSGTEPKFYANAWRYRDWVIGALNRDLPYDRFLMAQLAGDLMNDPSLLGGLGLMGGGPWYYGISQPPQARADERNDRVDVVSRGMMGVTLACARCHDHKYDPLSMKDYYGLAGVFASSKYQEYPLAPQSETTIWDAKKQELDKAGKALRKFLDEAQVRVGESFAPSIAAYLLASAGASPDTTAVALDAEVLARWKTYLAKPEEFHPFLREWFATRSADAAGRFQQLILDVIAEKRAVDEENRRAVEAAEKTAPKVLRTIVLPGGYRSDEDFNPGAYVQAKSIDRDRYVAYNRTFGERISPLKFDEALTVKFLDAAQRSEYEALKARRDQLKKELPPQYPFLMGLAEFDPVDLNMNLRGNPELLGEAVPRRFPLALSGGREIPLRNGSGRLELARQVAIHPITARVAANRVWMHLFGEALVRTPSNFGIAGDRPSNPPLLDYLAARLVGNGYSIKRLIAEIAASSAYQRSAASNATNEAIDGGNREFWRQNRRRLEAEPLRDAMLATADLLDRTLGGESKPLTPDFKRRTVYARTGRFEAEETLSLFDLPSASVTCEKRVVTNVPLQKLYFLNSETTASIAARLGEKLAAAGSAGEGIRQAYRRLFHRAPSANELKMAESFLSSAPDGEAWKRYAQVLLSTNEFAYVD